MKQHFETSEYIAAIDRELAKRATTYPKILVKMAKQRDPAMFEEEGKMTIQSARLAGARRVIIENIDYIDPQSGFDYVSELVREYKMRKRVYPRFIYFKRIDETTAQYELAVWRELCIWFAEKYLGQTIDPDKKYTY